jgi:hypothetical protein
MLPVVEGCKVLAAARARITSPAVKAEFDNLIHPVPTRGAVYAWGYR